MTRDIVNHLVFEVATEVANKVGGIYSVLKSKAPITCKQYGPKYLLLGPLNPQSVQVEVEPVDWEDESNFHIKEVQWSLRSMHNLSLIHI